MKSSSIPYVIYVINICHFSLPFLDHFRLLLGIPLRLPLVFLFPLFSLAEESPLYHQDFQSTLQSAFQFCLENNFTAAHQSFQDLDTFFGQEPEYQNPQAQESILPLSGYAAFLTGDFPYAINRLSTFIDTFPLNSKKRAFAQFTLAQAFQADLRLPEAIEAYQQFAQSFPQKPEAAIAQLRIADLFLQSNHPSDALLALDQLYQSHASSTLRIEARLRSLQIALDQNLWDLASETLFLTDWDLPNLPQRYPLSIAALQLGDYLLQQNQPAKAIDAYRFVPSKDQLLTLQRQQLRSIQNHLNPQSSFAQFGLSGIWSEYYRSLANNLESRLLALEAAPDYTPAFLLRYGQAFAQANRHFQAWLIYESIALDDSFDLPTRQEAHYRQILSIQHLGLWNKAIAVAQSYADLYPNSPHTPIVLFLIANALQQLKRPQESIDILNQIITSYPTHPALSRWIFTRGFNELLLDNFTSARLDFTQYVDRFPNQPLATNARLWLALTFFFEKDYGPALESLDRLIQSTPDDHYLQAEMHYRRGAVLYALRNFDPALEQIDQYLQRFPQDRNHPQALVLRGDILMGLGRLLEAALAFRQVTSEAQALYPYAIFQTGKIYRATEDYDRLVQHFTKYLDQTASAQLPRIAEALYWIGWAREKQGRLSEAFPRFLQAIQDYGNDPHASEIQSILSGLQRIHQQIHATASETIDVNNPCHQILTTASFTDWIDLQSSTAFQNNQLTYYARLTIYKASLLNKSKKYTQANQLYLDLGQSIPLRDLDAQALALVGMAQLDAGSPLARVSFNFLLKTYPQSPHHIEAFIGLGQLAFQSKDWSKTIEWLQPVIQSYLPHPLAPKAALIYSQSLQHIGDFSQAKATLNDILKLKSARGRLHAEALLQLASIAQDQNNSSQAIAYYQRVYNLYRAFPDLVVRAYFNSALLFEKNGDLQAAFNTYREMLLLASFQNPGDQSKASQEYDRLQALIATAKSSQPSLEDSSS